MVGLPDISQLWNAIETKEALGIVNCRVLWALNPLDLFPSDCRNLIAFNPGLMNSIIVGYNQKLQDLVAEFNLSGSHFYFYTNAVFNNGIIESEVSDIDCYHPSAHGQSVLIRNYVGRRTFRAIILKAEFWPRPAISLRGLGNGQSSQSHRWRLCHAGRRQTQTAW